MNFSQSPDKKIVQITPRLGMGGVEQGTIHMAQAIVNAGFKSFVITQDGSKIPLVESAGAHVTILPVASKNPFVVTKNIFSIKDFCTKHEINVIHARSRMPAWSALAASKIMKIPFVTTFHGTYNFSNFPKLLYNSVMVRGDKVIAISDFIKQHILDNYSRWVTEDRISTIHRGIDCKYFDPSKCDDDIIRKLKLEWQHTGDEPIYLMPGRLTSWKGHLEVIRMIPYLSKGIVVFLGSDQGRNHYTQSLKEEAIKLGVTDRIRFIDECKHMREAYSISQGVIHASTDPEAFGRVVAEAQAMGKPIVVSDLGAPKEIIEPNITGWVISPYKHKEMAIICEQMSQHQSQKFKEYCRNRIQTLFTLEIMIKKTLDVYDGVMDMYSKRT
jgi:glycosyltransferase involved in cell wall biosynthesis